MPSHPDGFRGDAEGGVFLWGAVRDLADGDRVGGEGRGGVECGGWV